MTASRAPPKCADRFAGTHGNSYDLDIAEETRETSAQALVEESGWSPVSGFRLV